MEMQFLYWIQTLHTTFLDAAMVWITKCGNKGIFWILLAIVYLIADRTDRKCGWHIALSLLLSALFCNLLLKNLVARSRPCWIDDSVMMLVRIPKDYSFPSGHSSASFAAALSLWFHHKKAGTFAIVLALLIAFSRMYLFVHWPTDVLGGLLIGMICSLMAGKITGFFREKEKTRMQER